jgi:hypothetical protein
VSFLEKRTSPIALLLNPNLIKTNPLASKYNCVVDGGIRENLEMSGCKSPWKVLQIELCHEFSLEQSLTKEDIVGIAEMRKLSRKAPLLFVIGFASLFAFGEAKADWVYTKWGMTPTEVANASQGQAARSAGDTNSYVTDFQIGNVGTFRSGPHNFKTTFYFQSDQLTFVHLKLMVGSSCLQLESDLDGLYGRPISASPSSNMYSKTWHDRSKNNRISLLVIGETCSIDYRPLRTDGNSRL